MHAIIDAITHFFQNFLSTELTVLTIAMFPLIELRGAIPVGVALGLPMLKSIGIAFVGSSIPAFFIIFFIGYIFNILRKIKFMNKFISKLNAKTLAKKDQIEKYGYLGLFLFVGIPLPGTGAWTGSLLAYLLNLDKKKSLLAVIAGNALAALITALVSGALFKIFG